MERTIKIGICSYGYSTKVFHAPLLAVLPEYEISAIVERHKDESREKYPNTKLYRSCEEMFADPDIDVVIVNTPNTTHYEYAEKALLAGKHVIIDKPFTSSTEDATKLIELAKQQNLKLIAYHNRRWEGELLAIKEIVDQKLLGRLLEVEFKFERFRKSLNVKAHKEEDYLANDIIFELGTHLIDQALFIFGMPKSVFADIFKQRKDSQIEDYCSVILYYPNNLKVTIRSSLLVADQGPAYVLHGTRGSFKKHRANIQEEQLTQGILPTNPYFSRETTTTEGIITSVDITGKMTRTKYPTPRSSYLCFYKELSESFFNDAKLPVSAEDVLDVLRIIEAAYKSSEERKVVNL